MNYIEKLRKSARDTGSIACMGLDPVVDAMHSALPPTPRFKIEAFFEQLFIEINKQRVFPSAFKSNQGFYLRHSKPLKGDFSGSRALAKVFRMLRKSFPSIPIILDNKRGDIDKSSANYAAEGFDSWGADAVTVHPYMGFDSVLPFAGRVPKDLEQPAKYCNDEAGKGVYVLCRTSNPGAKDFQDLEVIVGEEKIPLYMAVAHKVVEWAKYNPGIGAVVGATYLEELSEIAKLIVNSGVDVPLLIPGIGKKSAGGQGGSADEVVAVLKGAEYPLPLARINSSSGITHPWAKKKKSAPKDWAKVCVESLNSLNEAINYKP